MGKKTNRSVKKRRIVVAPSSDLDEDMSSGEEETKDVKENDNEQKPYLTLNGTNSDSEESKDAEDSDKEVSTIISFYYAIFVKKSEFIAVLPQS